MLQLDCTDGKARAGVLSLQRGQLNTPGLLVYTRRGGVLNLTPDLLEKLRPSLQAVQMDAMHFIKYPSPEILREFGKGIHKFVALDDYLIVATTRDPTTYEYGIKPSTDQHIFVSIHSGTYPVTPAVYMDIIDSMQPDVFVTLSDEITADVKPKRCITSVNRTLRWLDECLELQRGMTVQHTPVLASIQGGALLEQRKRCASEAARRPVAGFMLSGFGTGETPEQRAQLLAAILDELPPHAPRFLTGIGTPEEVLEAVEQGVDVLDCGFLESMTTQGYALTFPVDLLATNQQPAGAGAQTAAPASGEEQPSGQSNGHVPTAGGKRMPGPDAVGSDDSKINLWAEGFTWDQRPLLPGCTCFTCQHYNRGYVHHLLLGHELLATVLLEMHNTHHYLAFFAAIRRSILADRFQEYKLAFAARKAQVALQQDTS